MTRSKLFLAVTAVVLAAGVGLRGQPPTVRIDAGLVSGVAGVTPKMRVFKGIPFAAPPIGPFRWRPPQPVRSWNGVRQADQFSARCVQPAEASAGRQGMTAATAQPMSEDCLYLNVWTEAASASERRPVIVWSHGGAFTIGTGSGRDGEALARKGAVGRCLQLPPWSVRLLLAPRVKQRIGAECFGQLRFDGPLGRVALGEAKHHRVWRRPESGDVGGPIGRRTAHSCRGRFVAGKGTVSPRDLTERPSPHRADVDARGGREARARQKQRKSEPRHWPQLRAKPADEIQRGMQAGRLVVDGWYVTEDISITIAEGRQNRVDLLVGSNKDEATFVSLFPASPFFGLEKTTAQQFTDAARRRFGSKASAFLDLYPAGSSDDEARASQRAAFRDEAAWNARDWARAQTRAGGKVYLYYFVHEPPVAPGQPNRGATHGAEIPYVFNNPVASWTDVDRALADAMSSYWVNFAASGDPNGAGLPVWPAFQPNAHERTDPRAEDRGGASDLTPGAWHCLTPSRFGVRSG